MGLAGDFFESLQEFARDLTFAPKEVERLTGLGLMTLAEESTDYYEMMRSQERASGLIRQVECRYAGAKMAGETGFLILYLNPTPQFTLKEVIRRFGPDPELLLPRPPQLLNEPVGLVYRERWGEVRFVVEAEDQQRVLHVVLAPNKVLQKAES